jgi:mycothiol S-conjugate amidase
MRAIHEGILRRDGESPFDEKWFDRPDHDHRITTRVEVGEYQWARSQALRAHATQVDPAEGFWFALNDLELAQIYPYEDWILARSLVGPIPQDGAERDLFDGVRASVASDRHD